MAQRPIPPWADKSSVGGWALSEKGALRKSWALSLLLETKEKADKSTFVSHLLKSAQGMVRAKEPTA